MSGLQSIQISIESTKPAAPERNWSTATMFSYTESAKKRKCLIAGNVVVTVAVLVILILFSLPIVFFYVPTALLLSLNGINSNGSNVNSNVTNSAQCSSPILYSGSVCRNEILLARECLSPQLQTPDAIFVATDASEQAQQFINGLRLISSPECIEAARPFLCLSLFGVCDGNGGQIFPTEKECLEISTGVCKREFELASTFGLELLDCSGFPEESPCSNSSEEYLYDFEDNLASSDIIDSENNMNCTLSCRENFYCDDTIHKCVPQCSSWSLYPTSFIHALSITILISAAIGTVAGIGVLVVSCMRYKKVYVFPSVFVVYQTIDILVIIFFHIVTYIDRNYLYCSSENLLISTLESTGFCIVSGMMLHYFLLQANFWWVFHMIALYWKVAFPSHAKYLRSTKRLRLVHGICVLIAVLVPLIPVIAIITNDLVNDSDTTPGTLGFGFGTFPPILCVGLNMDITFYTVILPNVILITIGTITLVLVIWKIHKGLFTTSNKSNSTFSVSTAEKKLFIIFFYYIFLQVMAFIYFSLSAQASGKLEIKLFEYFVCEEDGYDPNNPCDRSGFENLIDRGVAFLTFVLALLAPITNFVFVVDYRELKQKISTCFAAKDRESSN